ncbi:MAG: glutathione S-transferase family protein [Devosia sp.]
MLRVLGRVTSINARKVLWTADEIGLTYEREDWGLPIRDPRVGQFLALNPNAQVPVLIDDGFALWESNAIMRYLGERHASPLWPTQPRERALVDQWMSWQATELNPAWTYAVYALLRRNPAYTDQERIAASIGKWTEGMQILEDRLQATGDYVANHRFSLADIVLALSTHRWMMTPFDKPKLPAVAAHYARVKSRAPAVAYLGAETP